MGRGLSDSDGDGVATADEWRTAPLWGIGLLRTVNAKAGLLHDGRARNFDEAIRWHGGEAAKSRESYETLSEYYKECIIKFLRSL
jgi:CxxC motif-containing protein (DUF1111 family)